MIYVVKNIFNKFDDTYKIKQLFMKSICNKLHTSNMLRRYFQYDNFLNFEYISLIIEICDENQQYMNNINYYLKMFDDILVNRYTNLKLLKKFIKHYDIKICTIKEYLETKEMYFIQFLINSQSLEKIIWFFDNVQEYTKFITKSNYLELFRASCNTNNVEIAKYIYNIIGFCGLEITKKDLKITLDTIIFSIR